LKHQIETPSLEYGNVYIGGFIDNNSRFVVSFSGVKMEAQAGLDKGRLTKGLLPRPLGRGGVFCRGCDRVPWPAVIDGNLVVVKGQTFAAHWS